MRRIDFIGIPAAGKSTLNRRLQAQRRHWLTPAEARTRIVHDHLTRSQPGDRVRWWLLSRIRTLEPLATQQHAHGLSKSAIKRAGADWHAYFGACLAAIPDIGKDAVESMEWLRVLYQVAYDVALVEAHPAHDLVVFDESLTHRTFGLISTPGSSQVGLRAFEHLPAPTAVIYCHAPVDEVVRRVLERRQRTGKLIRGHVGLSHDALAARSRVSADAVARIVDVLTFRGIRVVPIDTTAPLDTTVQRVSALLDEWTSAPPHAPAAGIAAI